MAKPAKPAPAEAEAPAKPKSKRLLLAAIGVLLLGAVGGAGWYFLKGSSHAEEPKAAVAEIPTFLELKPPFTVNLQHEEGDQVLAVDITLKVASMELADKIRQRLPEVRSRLIFLLSSKRASELMQIDGKKKLVQEIMMETNATIGMGSAPAKNVAHESNAPPNVSTESGVEAAPAPVEAAPVAHGEAGGGVLDVLFTSFIIQ